MPATPVLLWLRQDLRLDDNAALHAAVQRGGPLIPVFIWAPQEEGVWSPGAASRWWLQHSLHSLEAGLRQRGSRLIVRQGASLATLQTLLQETGATAVYWNRRYEPVAREREARVQAGLQAAGLEVGTGNAALLVEPWDVCTQAGKPFQVFTPFWRACRALLAALPAPVPAPERLPAPEVWPQTLPLAQLRLEPEIDWAAGLRATWQPGEAGALACLARFTAAAQLRYGQQRDYPGVQGTSSLSPYLHFGELSPRRLWQAIQEHMVLAPDSTAGDAAEAYLRQLGWREFAYHVLYHRPDTPASPLRTEFAALPWRHDPVALRAWQRGHTGYPLIDAGMRALWHSGWMHNRVRMLVASFLVKHLLLPWQAGAEWFWDTLVDADLANNTLGWQWTAGCGADAAPFFRIFNPVTQGRTWDAHGHYVRRWVPELARLPNAWLHCPWEAPAEILLAAGVELGRTYPLPLVQHASARKRALAALQAMRA